MTNPLNGGITRSGSDGSYVYNPIAGADQLPITGVSWFDAARFVNWLANGQPTGASSVQTTEDGAYILNGAINGLSISRNTINPKTGASPLYAIPTEDEWYKAAFYSPKRKRGAGGYYLYATQSNTAPTSTPSTGGTNEANLANNFIFHITQSNVYDPLTNYLTDVGTFSQSRSFYGTTDQADLVYEWNDLNAAASPLRGLRGGYWFSAGQSTVATTYSIATIDRESSDAGFRLAAVDPLAAPIA